MQHSTIDDTMRNWILFTLVLALLMGISAIAQTGVWGPRADAHTGYRDVLQAVSTGGAQTVSTWVDTAQLLDADSLSFPAPSTGRIGGPFPVLPDNPAMMNDQADI